MTDVGIKHFVHITCKWIHKIFTEVVLLELWCKCSCILNSFCQVKFHEIKTKCFKEIEVCSWDCGIVCHEKDFVLIAKTVLLYWLFANLVFLLFLGLFYGWIQIVIEISLNFSNQKEDLIASNAQPVHTFKMEACRSAIENCASPHSPSQN